MGDLELLEQYATGRSPASLEELIRRHAGWVHSVAMRRVRDRQIAEDVTQEVFLAMARRPPRLRDEQAVAGWLLRVACHLSATAVRREVRRKRREKVFAMDHPEAVQQSTEISQREWDEIAAHLDQAVLSLNPDDQQVVLLRFYHQKSHADVAATVKISPDAARQRVGRAVTKLRDILLERGVTAPATVALDAGLLANTSPPAAQSASLAAPILDGVRNAGTSGAMSITKGALFMLTLNQAKVAIIASVTALLLVGGGTAVILRMKAPSHSSESQQPRQVTVAVPAPEQSQFDQVYRLAKGELVKWIRREDFTPDRAEGTKRYNAGHYLGPDCSFTFRWDEGHSKAVFQSLRGGEASLGSVLGEIGIRSHSIEGPSQSLSMRLGGDWIIRPTPDGDIGPSIDAVLKIVHDQLGTSLKMASGREERDVIVAKGKFVRQPGAPARIQLAGRLEEGLPDDSKNQGGGTGPLADLLIYLGGMGGRYIVDETDSGSVKVTYELHLSFGTTDFRKDPAALDELLASITAQCGLKFTKERRVVQVWTLTEESTGATSATQPAILAR